ncbi:MAG: ABC transporter ATP-binding protein [Ruminococcus sp.]|nr:ABC transporter ATP-binding protein [Ruminococcus sp.]
MPVTRSHYKGENVLSELLIETNELTKKFRKFVAVDKVSMHVEKGSVYGFIGKNGAGKTTFMKMVCGLSRQTSGEITLFGEKNDQLSKVRKRIGCLIESPGIYPKLSAFDNLKMKSLAMGCYDKKKMKELLEFVGLSATGKKAAGAFSLGMKQRLGIAMALIGDPEMLVLDEPINGLDPQGIVEVRDTISKLSVERGITILISSHILDELSRIATHYGIINRGELIKEISAEALRAECTARLEITADDAQKAARVLENLGASYKLLGPNHLTVINMIDRSGEINTALIKNGVTVSELAIRGEELEEYYLGLTGGAANA